MKTAPEGGVIPTSTWPDSRMVAPVRIGECIGYDQF